MSLFLAKNRFFDFPVLSKIKKKIFLNKNSTLPRETY